MIQYIMMFPFGLHSFQRWIERAGASLSLPPEKDKKKLRMGPGQARCSLRFRDLRIISADISAT
jgi:hypothetical protein